jgi:hypothetical protein
MRNPIEVPEKDSGVLRQFSSGATRDTAAGKHDYDGFLSPLVLEAFGTYMDFNRLLPTGATRDSDNWQKGIPLPVYVKSGWRHFIDWWRHHRGYTTHEGLVWAICGLLFNANGYLHEYLKAHPDALRDAREAAEERRKHDPRFSSMVTK